MRGNQPASPCVLFQELILASWRSSSIHTHMKAQKSTGLVFPPWSSEQAGLCEAQLWGSVGQAGWAEGLTWLCKRELVLLGRTAGLSSTGGGLQRDWVMQDQESSGAAAMERQLHCAEEGKAQLCSSVISFSLQSCGRREGGTALGRSGEVWV